jgi:predicted amidohydrolase YtcJ
MVESFKASGGGSRLSVCLSGRESRTIRGKCHGSNDWSGISDNSEGTCSPTSPEVLFEKHFMDGSIGAGTACFSKEFSKMSIGCKILLDSETLKERAVSGLEDGLLPMVHAIGDEAISCVIEPLLSSNVPFRIEHSEALTKDHLKGLKGTKGCLSLQPNFQRIWGQKGGLYSSRLGPAYRRLNPFRSLSTSSVNWCFGSDMMPPGPIFGIAGATGHIDRNERLGTVMAFKGYSEMSARFSIRGSNDLGVIKEGAWADLIVVGPDLSGVKALYLEGIRKHW